MLNGITTHLKKYAKLLLIMLAGVLLYASYYFFIQYPKSFAHQFLINSPSQRNEKCNTPIQYQKQGIIENYGIDSTAFYFLGSGANRFEVLELNAASDEWIIMVHGKRECRFALFGLGRHFQVDGYNVLIPVLAAHGLDTAHLYTDYGKTSVHQVLECIDFAKKEGARKIGIFGRSMGGSIALLAAAHNSDVDAVIADCPPKSVQSSIEYKHELYTLFPKFPFLDLKIRQVENLIDTCLDSIAPLHFMERVHCPVYIFAALDDKVVNPQDYIELFENANEPKFIWKENLNHTHFHHKHTEEFMCRIYGFFDTTFQE